MTYGPLLGSSDDPEKLSRTISGLVPLLILVSAWFNLGVGEAEISTTMDFTSKALFAVLGAYEAIKTAYGAWRKIYNSIEGR